jgi:aspartyl-tRNA synthetase
LKDTPSITAPLGVDRRVMLVWNEQNLREVMVLPIGQRAEDLLMGPLRTLAIA